MHITGGAGTLYVDYFCLDSCVGVVVTMMMGSEFLR